MSEGASQDLRDKVRAAYSRAAEFPEEKHGFPVGRAFAESLGYPSDLLDQLPRVATEAFAGVSNVSVFAEIPQGATVLDLGCGAGLDTLVSARRVGPSGTVIAVDFSPKMLARARQAAAEAGVHNIVFQEAAAECLPIADEQVDVALINGIFNLDPNRKAVFRELGRVVRPGGTAYAAELVLSQTPPDELKTSDTNWFA